MRIEVTVPALLADCTQGQTTFTIEGATLQEALDHLLEVYPLLRRHLYEETGRLRPHVLLFYNESNISRLECLDVPIQTGDRLQIVQAVSGG